MKPSSTICTTFCSLLCSASLAIPAWSQEADQPEQSNVAQLMEVMGVDEQLSQGFDAMMPMIEQMAQGFGLDADGKAELEQIFKDWFEQDVDQQSIIGQMSALYEELFTAEEIDDLIAFYSTPTGKKLIKNQGELMNKGAQIGMEEGNKKQAELDARLRPFFEKHGVR